MKDEFTTAMHADMLAADGWTREDVAVLAAYAHILRGIPKNVACSENGISVEFYDANIERVKKL